MNFVEKELNARAEYEILIPTFYSHVFMNKNTNEFFDLAVWDIGKVILTYIDEDTCEQNAKSKEEEIKNYSEIYENN